jgi:DtxR family Mn-dependent transcriptional regulator
VAGEETRRVTVRRIAEPIQEDHELIMALRRAGVQPGEVVKVNRSAGGVLVGSAGEYAELDLATAARVLVVDDS